MVIHDPIFQKNYYFIYTKTYQEYIDIMKKRFNKDEELDEECLGETEFVKDGSTRSVVIWVKYTGNTDQDNNTIAHEIYHAIEGMLEYCGVNKNPETSEVYAYVTGYITQRIMCEAHNIRRLDKSNTEADKNKMVEVIDEINN